MKQSMADNPKIPYVTPSLFLIEMEIENGFATSYDPNESIENVGSDLDYEEW